MDKTLKMARDAGGRAQQKIYCDVEYLMNAGSLEAFEALVRADEREACAQVREEVLEQYRATDLGKHAELVGDNCAAAIRARGNT